MYPNLPFPLARKVPGEEAEVVLEPKVVVCAGLLYGGAGKISEWMMRNEMQQNQSQRRERREKGAGMGTGTGADPSNAIEVDGEDGEKREKKEKESKEAAASKREEEGEQEVFFLVTVLMAAQHLLTEDTVPGRTDGTFKLWGSQSVSSP